MAPTIPDRYVDPGGSDTTGDGTAGNPYATVDKALSVLPDVIYSDATIYVADGVYAEGIDLKRFVAQPDSKIKIHGNVAAPGNVEFTGNAECEGLTFGCIASGDVYSEIEGIKINATARTGVGARNGAKLTIDRCIVTGTLDYSGIDAQTNAEVVLKGNNAVSGFGTRGINVGGNSHGYFNEAGTLTITGNLANTGLYVGYDGLFVVGWVTGLHIAIYEVKYGIIACLGSVFQHLAGTGSIVIDNTATPANSYAIQSSDASTLSTDQAVTLDHFTYGFRAWCTSYLEASGARNLTNIGTTSTSSLGGTLYLP